MLSGCLDCFQDGAPVLCITGMKSGPELHYYGFQDFGQSDVFHSAGIDWSMSLETADQAMPMLRNAIANAILNSQCAHIAIPQNVQLEKGEAYPCSLVYSH